ncbi:hypothetical protein ACJ5NV_05595 [Loktanella agnita]
MLLITDVTFFQVCMALLAVGLTERVLLAFAPVEMVGRNGWLIKGDIEE